MAKTRPGAKGQSKKGNGGRQTAAPFATAAAAGMRPNKSVRTLVDAALEAMTQGDAESALKSARAALRVIMDSAGSSNDSESHDNANNTGVDGVGRAAVCALLGEIFLETGDMDMARKFLRVSCRLDAAGTLPDALGGGPDKFLYLAQISEEGGRESVKWFERGAAALRARLQALDGLESEAAQKECEELSGKLAQVLCAVAEVWMTDLSFEADCEAQCEALVTEASLLAPGSPDVWQTLANVRASQDRPLDARAALKRSLALWEHLPPYDAGVPAFSVRVGLVRLLLTVGMLEEAARIATTQLLREDDEAVEVWYLAGYAHYLQGQEVRGESKDGAEAAASTDIETPSWEDYWRDARRCLGRCLRQFQLQEYEDERLGQHANELLEEVVAVVGPAPEGEEEEEVEGEWVDDNEEGDDAEEDEDEEMV